MICRVLDFVLIIVCKSNFAKLFGSLGTNSFTPLVFLTSCEVCEKTFVNDPHLAEHVTTEHTVVSEFLTRILIISEQLGNRDLESIEKDHLTLPRLQHRV